MGVLELIRKRGIKCSLYKMVSRLLPGDVAVKSACDRIGTYRYMKRYGYVMDSPIPCPETDTQEEATIIWLCWLQGYDNAPRVVRKCRESVYRWAGECRIVELSQENISQYIEVPEHIESKHGAGIIPHAHYTDYVRTALLAKYGGIWIDSTILLSDRLPDYINGNQLFCYQYSPIGKTSMGCCLLASPAGNPVMIQMKRLLETYWRRENRLVSYSIYHLFWTMVVEHDDSLKAEWAKVPKVYGSNIVVLQEELFMPYDERRWEQIKSLSSVHKLTYKYAKEKERLKGTFFEKIVGEAVSE